MGSAIGSIDSKDLLCAKGLPKSIRIYGVFYVGRVDFIKSTGSTYFPPPILPNRNSLPSLATACDISVVSFSVTLFCCIVVVIFVQRVFRMNGLFV